jgi:NAD(P)-dependent dehydrogenase (short-subunit alcohol dehydrogenase family)
MKDFRGKVAVVTGGASGIGRALAERLAREGMKVVIGDVEQMALDQTVSEMTRDGAEVIGVRCDVRFYEALQALASRAVQTFGGVHVLCNNAGVASEAAPAWRHTEADWEWVLGVNLWGVIHGIRAFVPRMLELGEEGHIVNTASLAGLMSMPFGAPYNVSKFGVVALTEALHYEFIVTGAHLRTSVLCPAWVRTRILDSARNRPAELAGARPPAIGEAWSRAFRARLDEGLSPEFVAGKVVDAIRDEQLYIWTHPEYKPALEARHADVVAGRNPDVQRMLGGLGKEAKKTV